MCREICKMSKQEKRRSVTDLVEQFETTRLTPNSQKGKRHPSFVCYYNTDSLTNVSSESNCVDDSVKTDRSTDTHALSDGLKNINDHIISLTSRLVENYKDNEPSSDSNDSKISTMAQSKIEDVQERARKRKEKMKSFEAAGEYVDLDAMRQMLLQTVNQIELISHEEMRTAKVNEVKEEPKGSQSSLATIKSDSTRSSNSLEDYENCYYGHHTYENLSDVMNSGIMGEHSKNQCGNDVKRQHKSRKRNDSDNEVREESSDQDNDYVTITMYAPVVSANMHNARRKQYRNQDKLHYKTLLTVSGTEDTQAEISMVKLSIDNIEKEEVQKFKDEKEYIVDELINTEEYYVMQLQVAINTYQTYLFAHIGAKHIAGIFSELENILIGTTAMLKEIKKVRLDYEAVGIVFLKNIEFFEKYPIYCKNKKTSEKLCQKYTDLIVRKEKAEGDRFGFISYLLLPIQRLAKYELLLKNLKRKLEKDNLPVSNVDAAVSLIQSISLKGNDLLELGLINGKSHEFTATGNFIFRNNFRMTSPKKMHVVVFLFKQKVIITEKDKEKIDNYKHLLDFHMQEIELNREEEHRTAFSISRVGKKKYTIRLNAPNAKIKAKWLDMLTTIMWAEYNEMKRMNALLYEGAQLRK